VTNTQVITNGKEIHNQGSKINFSNKTSFKIKHHPLVYAEDYAQSVLRLWSKLKEGNSCSELEMAPFPSSALRAREPLLPVFMGDIYIKTTRTQFS